MISVILSCTQDILAGTHKPTTTVLAVSMVPQFLVEPIAPYFLMKIPQFVRVSIVFVNAFAGFIIMAYVRQVEWKIAGVGIVTSGLATGLISIASLTSFFIPTAMSAYSTGTGVGLFAGTLYYTAFTTWLCVSPNVTIVVLSPLSILFLLSYYVINKNKVSKNPDSVPHKEVAYTKIQDKDIDDDKDFEEDSTDKRGKQKSPNRTEIEPLARKDKIMVVTKLFCLTVIPTFMIFFSHYILSQAVVTSIAYEDAPFRPRDHFQYYILALGFGEQIGRCHRSFLALVNLGLNYAPSSRLLWAQAITEILTLVLMIFEFWYHFFPSVGVVLFVCFFTGFNIGSFFDNMLVLLHDTFKGKQREFIMGYSMFPISAGLLAAAFTGLYVEPRLFEHCISVSSDSDYCFRRPHSLKDVKVGCKH